MKKTISISIRLSEEELDKLKQAARLESYSTYSEFIRRTALIEAGKILNENTGDKKYWHLRRWVHLLNGQVARNNY